MKDRAKWVDAAKFIAIIAVMTDHTNGFLYTDQRIALFSYCSVSLFILIMGITTTWSYLKGGGKAGSKAVKKCLDILRPYAVATIIIGLFKYREFDFEVMLDHLIHFNMSGPFYYVLLYCQLALIAPVLFYFLNNICDRKAGFILEAVGFVAVLIISKQTMDHSNILGVFAGGKLFGGTYLILFYMGMWFGKYYNKIKISTVVAAVLAVIASVCTVCWWHFITIDNFSLDSKLPFGGGINPPSISLGLYACLIALSLYFIEMSCLNRNGRIVMKIMGGLGFIGKHTLYIFLYHLFILETVFPFILSAAGIAINGFWIRRVVYFSGMILGSMLIEMILEKFHVVIRKAYDLK